MTKYSYKLRKRLYMLICKEIVQKYNLQVIYYGTVYYSYDKLKEAIEDYNERRIKEKLGWLSPVAYRLSLVVA